MKTLTLEGSPLHVRSVVKSLIHTVPSKHMKKFTLEQNLTHVNSVGNPSFCSVDFKYT
jgi:hypothetical protein